MKEVIKKIQTLQEKSNKLKIDSASKTSKLDDKISKLRKDMESVIKNTSIEMDEILNAKSELDTRHEVFIEQLKEDGLTIIDGKIEISNAPTIEKINDILKSENLIIEVLALAHHNSIRDVCCALETFNWLEYKGDGIENYINNIDINSITKESGERAFKLIEDIYGEIKVENSQESNFDEGRYAERLTFSIGKEFIFYIDLHIDGREGYHIVCLEDAEEGSKKIKLY